jgi:hypothetical protein
MTEVHWLCIYRKDEYLSLLVPDFDCCDIWTVAGYLSVCGGRNLFVHVDKAALSNVVVQVGWLILVPEAVIDVCLICRDGWNTPFSRKELG